MGLEQTLAQDLKEALRAGDRTRLSALRIALAAVHNAQIEKGRPLDDVEIVSVLQKQAKMYRESILEFTKGNRPELVAKEESELAVLEGYMPKQIERTEIVELARRIVNEVGAQGPRDVGKVMTRLMAEIRGRADGKVASQIVQEILSER
ncbi:MAG: GatB/YqeY domain-containing protein [Chloroflexota bacterium]